MEFTVNTELPLGVVTVTFSPGKHLDNLLDSLGDFTHVVLADNGSTDGKPQQAARDHEHVTFLNTGGNLGYGGGVNAGVRELRRLKDDGKINGEFFLITNPDAVFSPTSLEELIKCARRHPEAGAVGPKIIDNGEVYPSARNLPDIRNGIGHALLSPVWKNNPYTKRYVVDKDLEREREAGWLSGSCLLVRWEAFEAIGGFDERYFMYMEDVDFGDRLARAGWKNIFCPQAEIQHDHGHSTTTVKAPMLKAHHRSAYRYLADRHSNVFLRAILKVGLSVRAWALTC